LLARVKTQAVEAQQNQDIPFEQVVEMAAPVRSLAHHPLFQVMLAWNSVEGRFELPGMREQLLKTLPYRVAKFDLTLFLREMNGRIVGGLEYATALYEKETIERYLGYFRKLLEGMVEDTDAAIERLAFLSEGERQQVLYEWNQTRVEYGVEKCVQELFEEQVERTPEAVAVRYGEDWLSYAELNRRANGVAHALRVQGVGPETVVAIVMERGIEFLVAILGVFKAGGAYLPLDPHHPLARQIQIVEQSGAKRLVGNREQGRSLKAALAGGGVEVFGMEELETKEQTEGDVGRTGGLEQLAYVIFTSGSTGVPKGAMLEQRGMVNHLWAKVQELSLGSRDRIGQIASQCFDISVWQYLAGLLVGGQVCIYSDEVVGDARRLLEETEKGKVTVLEVVPSMLEAMLEELESGRGRAPELAELRWLVLTGEALRRELAERWMGKYPHVKVVNAYGPTECSDDVTHYFLEETWAQGGSYVAIGRPLPNIHLYVLGSDGQPVPVGVAGELCVGGTGVGRGYLKDAQATADAFVPDAFAGVEGARMYRTGDWARWGKDGNIEFLGRMDDQVKIRGFRIELGEIEARLREHAQVGQAVVMVREDEPGEKRLVAYYTWREVEGRAEVEELRRHMAEKLPEYMVPAGYVRLESLPLTANGKLDRKALPVPEGDSYGAGKYEAPMGEMETRLAALWAEVLKVKRVGRHDNFFALGGHSLLAVKLTERMRQQGLQVDVRALFKTPTVAELAAEDGISQTVDIPENRIITTTKHHDKSSKMVELEI
jgi:amino acid adenylation domain-containing protein